MILLLWVLGALMVLAAKYWAAARDAGEDVRYVDMLGGVLRGMLRRGFILSLDTPQDEITHKT